MKLYNFIKNRCLTIASFSEAPIDSRLFLGLWSGQMSALWQYRRQLALLTCRRKHTGRCTGHHPQAAPLVKHGMYLLTHLLIRTLVFEFNHSLPWSGHVSDAAKISQIGIFRVACGSHLKQRCHTTRHKRVDLPRLYSK